MAIGALLMCWGMMLSRAQSSVGHCHGSEQCSGDAMSVVQTQLHAQDPADTITKTDKAELANLGRSVESAKVPDAKPLFPDRNVPAKLSKADSASIESHNPFVMCDGCIGCLWKANSQGAYECRDTTSFEGANDETCFKNNGVWCTEEHQAVELPPDPAGHRSGPGGRTPRSDSDEVPEFPFGPVQPAPPTTTMAPAPSAIVAACDPDIWSYDDSAGWRACGGCGVEAVQSPIDLDPAALGDERYSQPDNSVQLPLTFYESSDHAVMLNDGNALRVDLKGGNFGSLRMKGGFYKAQELGFFFPSEHKVSGVSAAGELQIVLRNSNDKSVIISVFLEEGEMSDDAANFFDNFRHALPGVSVEGHEMLCYKNINIGLLGKQLKGKYWTYAGSESKPPCDPVGRFIMARSVKVEKAVLDDFRAIYAANGRPVQPLAGRVVSGPRNFAPRLDDDAPAEGVWR